MNGNVFVNIYESRVINIKSKEKNSYMGHELSNLVYIYIYIYIVFYIKYFILHNCTVCTIN